MSDLDALYVGGTDRVAIVFLDADGNLDTPAQVTFTVTPPSFPDAAAVEIASPDSAITLGKVFPLDLRTRLAARLSDKGYPTEAADLALGTGCVELLNVVNDDGTWQYYALTDDGRTQRAETKVYPLR